MKLQKFEVTWTMRDWINKHPVYAENYRGAVYDGRKLETQVPWDGNYGEWKCVISGTIIELRRIRCPKWLKISPTRTGRASATFVRVGWNNGARSSVPQ